MTNIREDGIVEFRFFRPDARYVDITGDFNDWSDVGGLTMCPDRHGWWTATARLDAGEYRFGYRADGTWFPDYASNGIEYTTAGCRSVLVIRRKREVTIDKEQRTPTIQNKTA
jgi:1,4-alpha-glucan branching enzyme